MAKQQKCSVSVPESRSPKSRRLQCWFVLRAVRENLLHALFQFLVVCWPTLMFLSLSISVFFMWHFPYTYVSKFPFIRTQYRLILPQCDLILTRHVTIRSHSQVQGDISTSTNKIGGDMIQPIIATKFNIAPPPLISLVLIYVYLCIYIILYRMVPVPRLDNSVICYGYCLLLPSSCENISSVRAELARLIH